jgi:predicted metal-binding protein
VCERCSTERIPDEAPGLAERMGDFNVRNWLKSALKERGAWGAIRVVSTSCLDVCAKGKVTVFLDPQTGERPTVLVVDPIDDRDRLLARILDM